MRNFFSCTALLSFCLLVNSCGTGGKTKDNRENSMGRVNVSKKEYEDTFFDIEKFINRMNMIIKNEDFKSWKENLTDAYISLKSSKEELEYSSVKLSLIGRTVKLRSLKDYFFQLVVPSRENIVLDSLSFIDRDHIIAFIMKNNKKAILYSLEKNGDKWKIGIKK